MAMNYFNDGTKPSDDTEKKEEKEEKEEVEPSMNPEERVYAYLKDFSNMEIEKVNQQLVPEVELEGWEVDPLEDVESRYHADIILDALDIFKNLFGTKNQTLKTWRCFSLKKIGLVLLVMIVLLSGCFANDTKNENDLIENGKIENDSAEKTEEESKMQPEEVVKRYFEYFSARDFDSALEKTTGQDVDCWAYIPSREEVYEGVSISDELYNLIVDSYKTTTTILDINIIESKIEENRAYVDIEVIHPDYYEVYNDLFGQMFRANIFNNTGKAEEHVIFYKHFIATYEQAPRNVYENQIELVLKENGEWIIDSQVIPTQDDIGLTKNFEKKYENYRNLRIDN